MKKLVSIILILVLLFLAVVPSYAAGESLVVSGLGSLATSLGLSSVWPVVGAIAVLVAGGVILTSNLIIPAVKSFFSSPSYEASMEQELTTLGTVPDTVPSEDVITVADEVLSSFSSVGIPTTLGVSNNISGVSTWPGDLNKNIYDYRSITSESTWFASNIPNFIYTVTFYTAYYYYPVYLIYNTLTHELWPIQGTYSSSQPTGSFTHSLGISYYGNVTLNGANIDATVATSPNLLTFITNNFNSLDIDYTLSSGVSGHIPVIFSPATNANTLATSNSSTVYTPADFDSGYSLTDETVISVPQTWEYDDNDDVFNFGNVGSLTPGLVIPSIPASGSISWDASPEWQDQSPDLPDWTYKIPLLGTIVRFLSWLGSLIKTLGDWLASLWDSIVGFFADVRQFFVDFGNFARDLLDLLRGSDLARFLSAILSFLSGYTLYQGLFSAYLPQCIAVVLWAGWLVIMAFWILRMVLDR